MPTPIKCRNPSCTNTFIPPPSALNKVFCSRDCKQQWHGLKEKALTRAAALASQGEAQEAMELLKTLKTAKPI